MKKRLLVALSAIAGLTITGCSLGGQTTPSEQPSAQNSSSTQVSQPSQTQQSSQESAAPAFDPTELLASFSNNISGTVKLVYKANYQVNVDSNGGTGNLDSFKRNIEATTTIEMDLTEGDYYFHATKAWEDKNPASARTQASEVLLFKGADGNYLYSSNTENETAVAAADAKAKVASLFTAITEEQVGVVDLDVLTYTSADKEYELKYVNLTDTFTVEDLEDPTYAKNSANGLTVTYKPSYIGYHTDNGWSDFSNKTDGYAATVTVDTDSTGRVTNWTEAYNTASLEFAIMTPPPIVQILGSRGFEAKYGEAVTKLNKSLSSTATITSSSVAVDTDFGVASTQLAYLRAGEQNPTFITDGTYEPKEGDKLAIKVNTVEGATITKVEIDGVECQAMYGMYFTTVDVAENHNIKVTTSVGSTSKVTVIDDCGVASTQLAYLRDGEQNPNFMTDGTYTAQVKDKLAIKVTLVEGATVTKVEIDGVECAAQYGMYFTTVEKQANHEIKVTTDVGFTKSAVTVNSDEHVSTTQLAYLRAGEQNPNFFTEGTFDNKEGDKLAIKVTAAEGYEVAAVKIDGVECQAQYGMYFTTVNQAKAHTIDVTTQKVIPAASLNLNFESLTAGTNYTGSDWTTTKYTNDGWVSGGTMRVRKTPDNSSTVINMNGGYSTTYKYEYNKGGESLGLASYASIDLGNWWSNAADMGVKVVLVDMSGNTHYLLGSSSEFYTLSKTTGLVTFETNFDAIEVQSFYIVVNSKVNGDVFLYVDNAKLDNSTKVTPATPVEPKVLYTYAGTASNGTAMEVNIKDNGTFDIYAPAYKMVCGSGTWTKDGSAIAMSIDESTVKGFTCTDKEISLTLAANFSTCSGKFFNGEDITFNYKKAETTEEDEPATPVEPKVLYTYAGTASNGTAMEVNIKDNGTFDIYAPAYKMVCGSGTWTKDGSAIAMKIDESTVKGFTCTDKEISLTIAADFLTCSGKFFNGDELTFNYKKAETTEETTSE